ncbi:MAG: hypothetical protein L3J22_01100 [Xanthomonadales bacterium]|nr:hypothetical protein [Xanthomonadales bacterium]
MKPYKIYFKGAGLVTAIGNSIEENLSAISQNSYKPSEISIDQLPAPGIIPYFIINKPSINSGVERLYQVIRSVIDQAIDDANLSKKELKDAGLFLGSTSFDMFRCELELKQLGVSEHKIATHIPPFNRLTNFIQNEYSLNGPVFTFNTACTSSANALMYASECIRRGDIKHALVVGLEFYNEVTALGFSGLSLVSSAGMRPFDQNRDGLYLGEGCSALIISAEPEENGYSFLAGANLGDTHSITSSSPDGSTIQAVIEQAIKKALIDKKDVAIIKTHGTASLANDEAEAAGLSKVFKQQIPPIVILKPFIGHTLGACGLNELILFYKALSQNILINFQVNLSKEFALRLATTDDVPKKGYFLLNYFGFGGNSTALVITNA